MKTLLCGCSDEQPCVEHERREVLESRNREIRAEIDRLHAEQDAIDREIERLELAEQAA